MNAIAFSPDGRILVTGDDDGAVWISDPHGRWPATLLGRHGDKVASLAFNSDGILASACRDGQIVVWKRG
ncbi:hypothetical protein AB0E59_17705 [Lentzea sp. NPDC034063]|uniref:WD40 repeat domain-containing protein n=1 Tax=unclassified Lentzea TaxID=2643253 RepID=UPI0033FCD565